LPTVPALRLTPATESVVLLGNSSVQVMTSNGPTRNAGTATGRELAAWSVKRRGERWFGRAVSGVLAHW
jgi:hypothetical protein